MSNALKCPNPACPYLFDPSRVPVGTVLACPRCGMRFTLGPPAPAAPAVAHPPTPQAPPNRGPAAAPPQPPPNATFENMTPSGPADAKGPAPVRSASAPVHRGPSRLLTTVLVFTSIAVACVVAAMLYFKLRNGMSSAGAGGSLLPDLNLSYHRPAAPWTEDGALRAKLGSPFVLVFTRSDVDAVMAFGARDYQTREPSRYELRGKLEAPVRRLFDGLEVTPLPDSRWLDQPAVAFQFRGRDRDGVTVTGQGYAASYRGIGYWSLCWAAQGHVKELAAAFDTTRGGFQLLNLREKWAAREASVRAIGGSRLRYELLDPDDVWREPDPKARPPADEDPNADLLLVARVKPEGHDRPTEATLITLILDSSGADSLADAQKYVEDKRRAEVAAGGGKLTAKFTQLDAEPEGDAGPTPTAPTVRLQADVTGARDAARLIVVSAIRVDNKVVAVYGWCAWADRDLFRAYLVHAAGSLRERAN